MDCAVGLCGAVREGVRRLGLRPERGGEEKAKGQLDRREAQGRVGQKQGKGKEFLCYFVFKTKFNFEPNQIQIEFKIHFFNSNKNEKFW